MSKSMRCVCTTSRTAPFVSLFVGTYFSFRIYIANGIVCIHGLSSTRSRIVKPTNSGIK